ncbi:MAG: hypothetical protein V2J02_21000 [Pseudomonadales bacterium]|jgi:hypothetical protein|nr:hypothetical protein [Pseudomonadales bacterium]
MSRETRWVGAVFVLSLVGVQFGGTVLLGKLTGDPAYAASALHQDLWRAGHAHAGQFLLLALVLLPWVDAARLSGAGRWYVRVAVSSASISFPLAFFLGAPTPEVTEPRPLLALIWPGAAVLASGLLLLGWGLLRRAPD